MGFSSSLVFLRKGIFLKPLIYLILLQCFFSTHANAQTTVNGVVNLADGATNAVAMTVEIGVITYRTSFTRISYSSDTVVIPAGANQANFSVTNINQTGDFYEIQYFCRSGCGLYEDYYFNPTGPSYYSPSRFVPENNDDSYFLLSELNEGTVSFADGKLADEDLEYIIFFSFQIPGSVGELSIPDNFFGEIKAGQNSNSAPYYFTYPPKDDFYYALSYECRTGCPDDYIGHVALNSNAVDYVYSFLSPNREILASNLPDIVDFEIIGSDEDNDNIDIENDNCPFTPNPDQFDADFDRIGNVCDPDDDNDTIPDTEDNCHFDFNLDQLNSDDDEFGNACDDDDDNDTVIDFFDNCPITANTNQEDNDRDFQGDACDSDDDNDLVLDEDDNCPIDANADQTDSNSNGIGDVCDFDIPIYDFEMSATNNVLDQIAYNGPEVIWAKLVHTGGQMILDTFGSTFDTVIAIYDEDGLLLAENDDFNFSSDNNSLVDINLDAGIYYAVFSGFSTTFSRGFNAETANSESGSLKVTYSLSDFDGDSIFDLSDNCPFTPNPNQEDSDGDGQGNACDADDDNDTVLDTEDNCPVDFNTDQADEDNDGVGDVCEVTEGDEFCFPIKAKNGNVALICL